MTRAVAETILVVSHLSKERDEIAASLRRTGAGVRCASTAAEALRAYAEDHASVVLVERNLPGQDGAALVRSLRAQHAEAVAIVIGARADVEDTVARMHEGAFHVLVKPLQQEHLLAVVQKALEHGRLSRGNRDLKSQLDISEKLAMIGRLASGVAHELNNPLDGVRRYVRMTQEGLQQESQDLRDYLERALSGLGRMASIVRQLLTFSRNVVLETEAESLRTMLDEAVRTLAPAGGAVPTIALDNPYVDLRVPRALFQVFVNLLRNALDAVEGMGARGRVRVAVARSAEAIEVRVSDNGTGISASDLRRVFEPFFTTKEVGRGTGLGLPISARIVERCGGAIRIESEPGQGTEVLVTLPVAVPAAPKALTLEGAHPS